MIDPKKAIDTIVNIAGRGGLDAEDMAALQTAILALDKQVPRAPMQRYHKIRCPICGKPKVKFWEPYSTCCGQRLKWE